MKRLLLLLMVCVSSQIIKAAEQGGSFVLSLPAAAVGGGVTYVILGTLEDKLGCKSEKLGWFLINTAIATVVPGLLAADYNDDGTINGSVLKNVFRGVVDKESLQHAGNTLIEKAGIVNVVAAFVGVILAERMFCGRK
jgi:hypothetical protein